MKNYWIDRIPDEILDKLIIELKKEYNLCVYLSAQDKARMMQKAADNFMQSKSINILIDHYDTVVYPGILCLAIAIRYWRNQVLTVCEALIHNPSGELSFVHGRKLSTSH